MKNVLNRRENLVVLCRKCHRKRHDREVKNQKLALAQVRVKADNR